MLKIRVKEDVPLLRIRSKRTFRISSTNLEDFRDRNRTTLRSRGSEILLLTPGTALPIPRSLPKGEVPPVPTVRIPLVSRITMNE